MIKQISGMQWQILIWILGLFLGHLACSNPLVRENREQGISASELKRKIDQKELFLLMDVRSAEEFYAGHLPGARLFPAEDLFANVAQLPTDRPIVLYCSDGQRSALVAKHLKAHGFHPVQRLNEGLKSWQWELVH